MDGSIRTVASQRLSTLRARLHLTAARGLRPDAAVLLDYSTLLWCDCHLMALTRLTTLITQQQRTVTKNPTRAPAAPRHRAAPRIAHVSPDPLDSLAGTRCPSETNAVDRLELALNLLGERPAGLFAALGVPEHAVAARLRHELQVLFEPCERLGSPRTWLPPQQDTGA
jgi:hypothetical protein